MSVASLSFEQAPPISVPLRFFLTAPAFGLLAAGVLAWAGPDALASRFSPALLAVTHLLVLGVLAMCMIGALLQMLPVVAGVSLTHARRVAASIHVPLLSGTLLLGAGFLWSQPGLLLAALPLAGGALLAFGVMAWRSLRVGLAANPTVAGMKMAVAALLVTASLGVVLAASYAGYAHASLLRLVDVHLGWGLMGWVGILVVAVAYQVVPMFQLTPPYPAALTRGLVPLLLMALTAWSGAKLFDLPWGAALAAAALVLAFATFAGLTLHLQNRRRRKGPDVTLRFWRLAMVSVLAATANALAGAILPEWGGAPAQAVLPGMLWIMGFAVSAVCGMLYKIVPFLVWLHAQSAHPARGTVPNMKQIIGDRAARQQALAHESAFLLLVGAAFWPRFLLEAGAALAAVSFLLLGRNLLMAWQVHRRLGPSQPAASGLHPVSR